MLRILSFEASCAPSMARRISISAVQCAKQMPPRPPPISENDITEVFLKGTGPGGQKINKTSSAVQLKHLPTGIVVKVQESRSRSQNRKLAREKLALRIEELEKGTESRVAIVAETKKKRKSSAVKKSKRKYRLLDEAKDQPDEQDHVEIEDVNRIKYQPDSNDIEESGVLHQK